MAEKIKHNDFIEVDYTGKLTDGTIFDTTSKDVAQKSGMFNERTKLGPATICVGEGQILPGLEAQIVDKEVGKEYIVQLSAENAFGKRDVKNVKIMPMSAFKEHKMMPQPGLQIDVDGELGTVSRVSGGRVIVNFNHPLSGKEVVYTFKVNKIVVNKKEKLSAYLNNILKIPEANLKIDVIEDKATVKLPFDLPEPFVKVMEEKILQVTGLKELKFVKEVKEEKK